MTTEQKIILLILAAIVLILAFFIIKSKATPGNKKLLSLLHRFALIRSFKVIDDINLPLSDEKTSHIDHILIGFFGIMVINKCDFNGTVYGDIRDKEWVSVLTKNNIDKKTRFKNPISENQESVEAIRKVFLKENIYKINIESYTVFTNKKAALSIKPNLPIMTLKAFKKLISKSKYSETGPVDVLKVYDAITKNKA